MVVDTGPIWTLFGHPTNSDGAGAWEGEIVRGTERGGGFVSADLMGKLTADGLPKSPDQPVVVAVNAELPPADGSGFAGAAFVGRAFCRPELARPLAECRAQLALG